MRSQHPPPCSEVEVSTPTLTECTVYKAYREDVIQQLVKRIFRRLPPMLQWALGQNAVKLTISSSLMSFILPLRDLDGDVDISSTYTRCLLVFL